MGFVTAYRATAAVLERCYDDTAAPMDAAAEVAERFGATRERGSRITHCLERPDETLEELQRYYGSAYVTGSTRPGAAPYR